MADKTAIAWTDATWNPVTGCTKVSSGCKNCYAERVAPRAFAGQMVPYGEPRTVKPRSGTAVEVRDTRPRRFTDVLTHAERLSQPLRWKRPRRVFVNSMSDLFHEDVPDEFIAAVFGVMATSRQHTFQVLTKRPERMLRWFQKAQGEPELGCSAIDWCQGHAEDALADAGSPVCHLEGDGTSIPWPLPNVWLGVSCENQQTADERIPMLLRTPAAVRFISAEPLLGPVILYGYVSLNRVCFNAAGSTPALDWVIVGGESGPGHRPMDLAWARILLAQCRETRTAFFFKQLGGARAGTGEDALGELVQEFPQVLMP